MKLLSSNHRGMALVMAMIVVVLITMLVAGAISFTGTERGAAQLQERGDHMSSCMVAARNLFLARMHALANVENIRFDETLTLDENGAPETRVSTRHFSGTPTNVALAQIDSVKKVTDSVAAAGENVNDGSNTPGGGRKSVQYYAVTATCRETNDPGSPEREIEFLVRVAL